jgi:hypothetical protein
LSDYLGDLALQLEQALLAFLLQLEILCIADHVDATVKFR